MKSWLPFICVLLVAPDLPAVVAFQVDSFSTSDPAGWGGGQAMPPTVVSGGPSGDYLSISTTNFHLGMKNQAQWGGDYISAGVTGIEADILGDSALTGSLRIFLFGPGGTWSTLDPVMIPADSGWGHYRFNLTPGDLVFVPAGSGGADPGDGTMTLDDTLASVQLVLFRHNTTPTPSSSGSHADHVTATLGFDNITAVPEPHTALLWLISGSFLCLLRRRIGL